MCNCSPKTEVKEKTVATKVVEGTYNLTKAVKSGYAPSVLVAKRLDICSQCPALFAGICKECLCIIQVKARFNESKCPLNKWQ
jgi:ribosomal protein L7Ae-like RNA K-turn-binding protein